MEQIKRALVNLRDEYQNFIIWRYLDEMSISEIAQITEKSEGSVRVGVHRALAALKDAKFPIYDEKKGVDYEKKTNKKLALTDLPITVTVLKIGNKFLIDPSLEEKKALDAWLTVSSLSNGKLCAVRRGLQLARHV